MNNKGSSHSFLLLNTCCHTMLSLLWLGPDGKGHPTGCAAQHAAPVTNYHCHPSSSLDQSSINLRTPPLTSCIDTQGNRVNASAVCAKAHRLQAEGLKEPIGLCQRIDRIFAKERTTARSLVHLLERSFTSQHLPHTIDVHSKKKKIAQCQRS